MSSMGPKRFDAFLSYNSQDRAAVEELERRLRREGLALYLEVWELPRAGSSSRRSPRHSATARPA